MIPNSHKKTILIISITIIAFAAIGFVMLSDNKTIQQFSNLTTGSVGEAVEAVAEDKPVFLSGSIEPKKVAPGDEVIVTVEIKDKHGIKEVLADMGGLATIELHLINKAIEQFNNSTIETWQGKWIAQGTGPQNYQTMVYAFNTIGKQSSMSINWEDPTITDTFDNEDKIASKTNIVVSGGQVKLAEIETACFDGIDNDGDGYVDCQDSDCSGTYDTGSGVYIYCRNNHMWTETFASGYEWGHYGELVGNCPSHPDDATYPACYACYNLSYAGFTDWILADKVTLTALWDGDGGYFDCDAANCMAWDSYCCGYLNGVQSYYWSSNESTSSYVWSVLFSSGSAYTNIKPNTFSVRCVRQ